MYDKNSRKAADKWIDSHRDHWNSICRRNNKKYCDKNRDIINMHNLNRYHVKKEFEAFRRILL